MSEPRYSIIQGDAVMDTRLSEIHLRVLLVLGRHTNKHGWAEVSQTKMAKNLGYSRQRVNMAFRDLTEWSYIEKRDQFDTENQGRTISKYRVRMDREPQDMGTSLSPVGDSPCHPQRLQPPVTSEGDNITTQDLTIEKKQTKKDLEIEFAEFWAQYPRKVAKPAALRAHLKARKTHSHAQIMAGTLRHAAAWQKNGTEKQFIPHPSTFLNQERFNDEAHASKPRKHANRTGQIDEYKRSIARMFEPEGDCERAGDIGFGDGEQREDGTGASDRLAEGFG